MLVTDLWSPPATERMTPGGFSPPAPRHKPRRKTSMVFDVKLEQDHVYVVVDDEDLVKSHLLLAVREEVDVLKANISKLVDKISALERENEVLKSNATPEVLAQLDAAPSQAPSPPPPAAPAQVTAPAQTPSPAPAPAVSAVPTPVPATVAPSPQQPPSAAP